MRRMMLCVIACILILPSSSFAQDKEEPHPVDEWIKTQQEKVDADRKKIESEQDNASDTTQDDDDVNNIPSSAQNITSSTNTDIPNTTPQQKPKREKRLIYNKPKSSTGQRMWN